MNFSTINKIKQNSLNNNQSKSLLLLSSIDLPINSLYQILSKNPNLVNIIDNKGETLLSYSIKRKKDTICQLILSSKILDLSYQDINGNSYLHLATINQLEGVVKTLIEKGIYINMQNNDGNTSLHLAYLCNNIPIIHILKNNHIDIKIKNNENKIAKDLKNNNENKDNLELENINITEKKNKSNKKQKEVKFSNKVNEMHEMKNHNKLINNIKTKNMDNNKKNKPFSENISYNNSKKKILNKNKTNQNNSKNRINLNKKFQFANSPINLDKKEKNNIINKTSPYLNNQKIKKEKSKKDIKPNNYIKNNKNSINENYKNINKMNYIEIGKNISEETKYKSGAYKEKIKEIKNKGQLREYQKYNLFKKAEEDIFNIAESIDYKQKLAHTSELNTQIVKSPKNQIRENKKIFQEDDLVNINDDIVNYKEKKIIDEEINNDKNNKFNSNKKKNDYFEENEDKEYYNDLENNQKEKQNNEDEYEYKENEIFEENESSLNFYENSILSDGYQQQKQKKVGFQGRNYYEFPENKDIEKNCLTNGEKIKVDSYKNKKFSHSMIPMYSTKNEEIINNKMSKNIKKDYLYGVETKSENRKTFSNIKINHKVGSMEDKINTYRENNYNHNYSNLLNNNRLNLKDDENNLFLEKAKSIKNNNPLKEFLSEIHLLKYMNIFIENGFDDINLIIDQAKKGIYIKDSELKEAGIIPPGDRAKILIRIQEKAGNFGFRIPKRVYYVCNNLDMIENDENINNLNNWLKDLKIDNYLMNFIYNGYHSIELLLMQMESKNPLTSDILKEEIGIEKVGHRSRILNKLKDEGRSYNNKLKTSILFMGNGENNKFCECLIY